MSGPPALLPATLCASVLNPRIWTSPNARLLDGHDRAACWATHAALLMISGLGQHVAHRTAIGWPGKRPGRTAGGSRLRWCGQGSSYAGAAHRRKRSMLALRSACLDSRCSPRHGLRTPGHGTNQLLDFIMELQPHPC